MMTKAEVRYTTEDGVEHIEVIDLAMHPIISLNSVLLNGVPIPNENIRVFEEE